MERILFYIHVWLSAAIGSTILHHLSQLSPSLNDLVMAILVIAVLLWFGAFLSDDRIVKWMGTDLQGFRFTMVAIAAAVFVGLGLPIWLR